VDFEALGARIRQLRRARGWSQEELAARAGITDRTVRNAENKAHAATLETIEKLATAFQMHPAKLLYPESTRDLLSP
jgi:transcriptional regulator with XRE-family HTH domain